MNTRAGIRLLLAMAALLLAEGSRADEGAIGPAGGGEDSPRSGFEGKSVRGGEAVEGARVFAYRTFADAMSWRPFAVSSPSAGDGTWRIDLPAGNWYLVAKKRMVDMGDGPVAAGDDFAFHGGNPVTAVPGIYRRVGFSLVRLESGTVYGEAPGNDGSHGSLAGVVTLGGKPAEGVDVLLFVDGKHDFRRIPYAVSPATAEDGSFLFDSLPEGEYYVLGRKRASGRSAGPLADGDIFGFHAGNPVPVKSGKVARVRFGVVTRTGVAGKDDSALLEGDAAIAGRILDREGKPVKGAYAFVYAEKAMSHKRPEQISRPAGEDGRYVLRLPQGGRYFLGARSEYGDTPSPGEWYGRYEGTPDHSIVVPAGRRIEEIDLVVEPVLR